MHTTRTAPLVMLRSQMATLQARLRPRTESLDGTFGFGPEWDHLRVRMHWRLSEYDGLSLRVRNRCSDTLGATVRRMGDSVCLPMKGGVARQLAPARPRGCQVNIGARLKPSVYRMLLNTHVKGARAAQQGVRTAKGSSRLSVGQNGGRRAHQLAYR